MTIEKMTVFLFHACLHCLFYCIVALIHSLTCMNQTLDHHTNYPIRTLDRELLLQIVVDKGR